MSGKFLRRFKGTASLIRYETRAYTLSLIGLLKAKTIFQRQKINRLEIGAGPTRKRGFISLDLSRRVDYPFDLRMGLPFPDESFDLIYSEHVLEHFCYEDLCIVLTDCYRCLKPGGLFTLAVPNAAIYLEAYSHPEGFDPQQYCLYREYRLSYKSRIDYVNYIFYMNGEHRYMFDPKSIVIVLADMGLRNVRLRDFDPNLDQAARRHESIYAEGIK